MSEPTARPRTARLRELLDGSTAALGEEALAEARALGPELAGDAVAAVIEAELARPAGAIGPLRAAHLVHELRLVRAVPALVRCLEVLGDLDPLHRAALVALGRLGADAVEPLLASFDGCDGPEGRARIAEALSRTSARDDRIRAAFARVLEDDPASGARRLADYGDWRAVEDLSRAFDRFLAAPAADCVICEGEELAAIASAMRVLGGALSEGQDEALDEILERAEGQWIPFPDAPAPPPPLRASAAPSRRSKTRH
jgi:hypothetical protein